MSEFLSSPLFALPLSLSAFLIGVILYRRFKTVLLHPIITASIVVATLLTIAGVSYQNYHHASGLLYALLGPAVVALAVPLKQNLTIIRKAGWPLIITISVGAILAPAIAVLIALLLGAGKSVLLALSGKSITTPIALVLAEKVHASLSLTAGIVVLTGVFGAIAGPPLMQRLKIRDERVIGVVLGINAHAVGTARALEISALCGACAALAMGTCGALTALILPLIVSG
ncbi:LrgB family protein [Microbulbifer sp. OS29]|uniref:LrgB family protein n=1 Tax=Microbulbifer okhotskensis TaxID=2926617 RepID=A0A9X2J4T2_9GAMM|nr:LrgB family protein [Microbulbifer okhotskensis]MCO1332880.1 LrgB family protein [Microbulbifer okhotskensis]